MVYYVHLLSGPQGKSAPRWVCRRGDPRRRRDRGRGEGRKDRVDDAMHATRAAMEEGIVPGGGVALLRASQHLKGLRTKNDDQNTGVEIVRKALS